MLKLLKSIGLAAVLLLGFASFARAGGVIIDGSNGGDEHSCAAQAGGVQTNAANRTFDELGDDEKIVTIWASYVFGGAFGEHDADSDESSAGAPDAARLMATAFAAGDSFISPDADSSGGCAASPVSLLSLLSLLGGLLLLRPRRRRFR